MRFILAFVLALNLGAQDPKASTHSLDAARQRIDKVDAEIVKLLNQRASIVLEIGSIKQKMQLPAAAPGREEQVLKRVADQARAPLTPAAVRKIYATIIAEMTAMEQSEFKLRQ